MAQLTVGDHTISITPAVGAATGDGPQQEMTSFGSVTMQCDLDGVTITMTASGNSPEAKFIDELASDVWVLGDVPMRMRLWAVWQEYNDDGGDMINMQGVSYKRLLNRRLIGPGPLSFPSTTDAGAVLWGLWQHTQAKPGGNLGVTAGDYLVGHTAGRNYIEGDNLGDLASQLTASEGLWWDVDSDLVFYAADLATRPFIVQPLQLGVNVNAMQRASGGADYGSSVYGIGGQDTTGVWVTDPNIATNPRGLWERAFGWPTVKEQTTVVEHTNAALPGAMQQLSHWNIEMTAERWITDSRLMPGDFAVLVVPKSLAGPVGDPAKRVAVQVTSTVIHFDQDGAFDVNIVVNETLRPLPN